MNSKVKIYVYHYIQADRYSKFDKLNSLSVDNFIRQIEYLKETKHNFLSLHDLTFYTEEIECLPDNAVMLTIDDGLKCAFSTIFPILKEYSIPAVFFPSARPFLNKKALNVTKLHYILASTDNPYTIFAIINSEFGVDLDGKMDEYGKDNRFDNKMVTTIKRYLQEDCPFISRTKIIDYLFKLYVTEDEDEFVENVYMSPIEMHIMKEFGCIFTFGAHGYLHKWMGKIGKVRNMKEILYSDRMLNKLDRKHGNLMPIKSFSYPYGSFCNETIEVLKKLYYRFGFTIEPRTADLRKDDPLLLPRYDCNDLQKEMEKYYK